LREFAGAIAWLSASTAWPTSPRAAPDNAIEPVRAQLGEPRFVHLGTAAMLIAAVGARQISHNFK
jgi:hypothetical protein